VVQLSSRFFGAVDLSIELSKVKIVTQRGIKQLTYLKNSSSLRNVVGSGKSLIIHTCGNGDTPEEVTWCPKKCTSLTPNMHVAGLIRMPY